MTSWRDAASKQAQDDLDRLLDESLPFARDLLERNGEFFPYAIALSTSGEFRPVAGDPGEGDQPSSVAVLQTLLDGLRGQTTENRAAAMVSDVRLPDSDAIRVELEHSEGQAIVVLLPYRKKRLRKGVDYGEVFASQGERQIWGSA